MHYAWRVTGRWAAEGASGEEDFLVETRTAEAEGAIGRGLRGLVSRCLRQQIPPRKAYGGEITVEITDLVLLGEVAEGAE